MDTLATALRQRHLQEVRKRLGDEFGDAPLVIYGAGQHTEMMLKTMGTGPRPRFDVILDDNPRVERVQSVPVRRPQDVDPAAYAGVVVSSDSIEDVLAAAAERWIGRCTGDDRPRIVRLYEGLSRGADAAAGAYTRVLAAPGPPAAAGPDGLPVPPPGLRASYSPDDDAAYLLHGRETNQAIRRALLDNGADTAGLRRILDWGCSSGRVTRFWADVAVSAEVWGCDIDEQAIDWAATHLSPPFRFFSTTLSPFIPVADRTFGLVYGISIFTHIARNVDAWLMELRRITAPKGHVLVTIHDEHTWEWGRAHPESYLARHWPPGFAGPLRDDFVATGSGPDSQTFWRTDAVRRRWSAFFDVLDIRPAAFCGGTQSGVLLRPRP